MILLNLLPHSYNYIVTIMLYVKETLILEEVTSTLLSNEIRKNAKSKRARRIKFGGHGKERKRRRKGKFELIEGMSLLSQGRQWKNNCKYR